MKIDSIWPIIFLLIVGMVCAGVLGYAEDAEVQAKPKVQIIEYHYKPIFENELYSDIDPNDIVNMDAMNKSICLIAQTLWGEARGMSKYDQSLVVWCILNRVDDGRMGDDIEEVIKRPGQFVGYSSKNPIDKDLYSIAQDVYLRWRYEKYCEGDVGRTLPKQYLFFYGKDGRNWFRTTSTAKEVFDFSTRNPY